MSIQLTGNKLPRLVYVGDVPVESSTHGSGLLFRLLQDYPVGKLLVVEGWPSRSNPARRLPGVSYRQFALWPKRGRSKFRCLASTWLALTASAHANRLRRHDALQLFLQGILVFGHVTTQVAISPDNFTFLVSVTIMTLVIAGGMDNTLGVIVGAFLLTMLPEKLRAFSDYRILFYGLVVIALYFLGVGLAERR